MAVAQTQASDFGRGESNFRVSKKLMLQAHSPASFARGTPFQAASSSHNFTDARGTRAL